MVLVKLYDIRAIKDDINESGTSNNRRIRRAGEKAQSEFEEAVENLRTTILTSPDNKAKELVNFGAVAWFYLIENGDDTLHTKYLEKLDRYKKEVFGKPRMKTRGAF